MEFLRNASRETSKASHRRSGAGEYRTGRPGNKKPLRTRRSRASPEVCGKLARREREELSRKQEAGVPSECYRKTRCYEKTTGRQRPGKTTLAAGEAEKKQFVP